MKKYILFIALVISIVASISCGNKNPASPQGPSYTKTATPTITVSTTITVSPTISVTPSVTITVTLSSTCTATPSRTATPTSTPKIEINCSLRGSGTGSHFIYYISFKVNNVSYQYATITVNTDTLRYNGFDYYRDNGTTLVYTPGTNYLVNIQSAYGNYSCTIQAPGGNETVATNHLTVSYLVEGNFDYVFVQGPSPSTTTTFNSLNYGVTDITSGYVMNGAAYPGPGAYTVTFHMESTYLNGFSGTVTPYSGRIEIYNNVPVAHNM